MTKSEQIGYVFEYACLAIFDEMGISASVHDVIDESSIVSDLTIKIGSETRVLFLTHTRTQGMTNRKFYRTFEELAQRRTRTPKAICVNIALFEGGVRSPSQYQRLYSSLFDGSIDVFPRSDQAAFVDFALSFEDSVSRKLVAEGMDGLQQSLRDNLERALNNAIACKRKTPRIIDKYWQSEKRIPAGNIHFDSIEQSSIKLGLKLIALTDGTFLEGKDLSDETTLVKGSVSKEEFEILQRRGVIVGGARRLGGATVVLPAHICKAYLALQGLGVTLSSGWITPYLLSEGAKLLYSQIMDPGATEKALALVLSRIGDVKDASDLLALWHQDLVSDAPRADHIDASLRIAKLSQNDLSTRVQEALEISIAQRNPMWFLVAKDGYDEVIDDLGAFLECAAEIVWSLMNGKKQTVKFWDFYEERRKTFLSHRSVRPERLLLDVASSAFPVIGTKSRSSVLPRMLGLPSRFSMSVQGSLRVEIGVDHELFIVTISTPDPQHHKHKEFSGKIRAIRYLWDSQKGAILRDKCTFLAVIDGAWSAKQVRMLSNAGWRVCGWDELSVSIQSIAELPGAREPASR